MTFKFPTARSERPKLHDFVGPYLNPPDKVVVLCVEEKSQVRQESADHAVLHASLGVLAEHDEDLLRHHHPQAIRSATAASTSVKGSHKAR
jgi:hypothetical protein